MCPKLFENLLTRGQGRYSCHSSLLCLRILCNQIAQVDEQLGDTQQSGHQNHLNVDTNCRLELPIFIKSGLVYYQTGRWLQTKSARIANNICTIYCYKDIRPASSILSLDITHLFILLPSHRNHRQKLKDCTASLATLRKIYCIK